MRFLGIVRRLPFTLFMEGSILVTAVLVGAAAAELSPVVAQRWGFGLHNLWEGRWHTLVTSTFFVRDRHMLVTIVLLLGYSIGIYEWMAGTRRAVSLYWVTNIGATAVAAIVFVGPLYWARTALGRELGLMSDVGASAGAIGCIGAWTRWLPDRYRRWAFLAFLAYFAAKLATLTEPFADATHLVAFPMGFFLDLRSHAAKQGPKR